MKNESTQTLHKRTKKNLPLPNRFLTGMFVVVTMILGGSFAYADHVGHNVAAGNVRADQKTVGLLLPPEDDNTNCLATLTLSVNDFRLQGSTSNRADYNVQVGTSAADDVANGVLITAIAQNVRTQYGTNSYGVSSIETNAAGNYRILTFGHGDAYEICINAAAAYFPYSNWIGGFARSPEPYLNGNTNYNFTGSPGLVFGTHFIDQKLAANLGGRSIVNLTSLGIDSRTDGILLVNHGKDRTGDGNYALSQVNSNNGTWTIYVHDIGADGASYEQDPVVFVYVPRTNTTVVSGRFKTDALGNVQIPMFSGASPQFTITNIAGGRWMLRIPGRSPTNGVLIVSPEGGGSLNADNIVTYESNAAGDGWELQSRDLPAGGLQSPRAADLSTEECMSFVYIPANLPGITVTPTNNLLTTEAGGTAQFTVVLDAPPFADVNINVSSSDVTEGLPSTSTLTFTTSNWSTPQTVTVTGQDDLLADASIPYTIILAAATSVDSRYNGIDPDDVSLVNADNEPGMTLSKNNVTTSEAGGSETFTIVLNTAPTDDVTIGLSSSDLTEGTVAPASVTFTTGNWNIPQTVTVTGVNDAVDDGNIAYTVLTSPATSTDTGYNGLDASDVSAINTDDDTAGYTFGTTVTTISEGGAVTNISLVLNSEPTANVTVFFSSGDTTEGAVTASLTFTPGNWSSPQNFTITPVDDFINDGAISYTVTTTVASSDPVYAALNPADVATTTLDNEAALTLPSGDVIYGIGDPGTGLDGHATVVDADTADYDTGTLTVTITANVSANDRMEIRNTGNGAGQIGVSGATISYGGTTIGTFAGGVGATPLVVTFNSASTPASAQALLRNVTYRKVGASLHHETRTVSVALADGDGGTSTASKTIQIGMLRVYDYQQGADFGFGEYVDAADNQIAPPPNDNRSYTNGYSVASGLWLDYTTTDNPQVLLRFSNVFGFGPGQIPPGATIVSADLVVRVNDTGNGGLFHRMLIPWDAENETWNTMIGGVQYDDIEAVSTNATVWGTLNPPGLTTTGIGSMKVGVTLDMQAWAAGQANHGWVIKPIDFAANGLGFSHCQWPTMDDRPRLHVLWMPAQVPSLGLRQNVNGYTNAFDTRLRESEPTTDRSAITALYSDWAVSFTSDNEHVLLRFGEMFGTGTNQIPPGSIVHSAVLELPSYVSNAPGAGGKFHALLKPWVDTTSTWDSWTNGVQADGVEAAVNYTAAVGIPQLSPLVQATLINVELTPDVQAWANGTPNYGWVVLPWTGGTDGWGFGSAESTLEQTRPQLRVTYTPPPVLLPPTWSPTSVEVRFTGATNITYSVLRAGVVTGPYTSIGTVTVPASGIGTNIDSSPLPGAAFYRVLYP